MKTYRIEALTVAIALIIMGMLLKQGLDGFSGRERTVNVKGLSEMEVPADKKSATICRISMSGLTETTIRW